MNLLPKDEKFIELFAEHLRILCHSSELLKSGLERGYEGVCDISKQMEAVERAGDEVIHRIFEHLRATFITPFDPEDIQALATGLDDIIDTIEDVTFRIVAYRLDPIPDTALRLGRLIDEANRALDRALKALRENRPVINDCIEVNRLENEADAIERTFVARLFSDNIDPITLMKQKEIIEFLEQATDRCEDVADIIQNVSVKNS